MLFGFEKIIVFQFSETFNRLIGCDYFGDKGCSDKVH
jgi:hypothetical protein